MLTYRAFGLTIGSQIELDTLVRVPEPPGGPDVVVEALRRVEPTPQPGPDDPGPWMRGRFPEGFVFEVRPSRIKMWVPDSYDDDLVRTYLLGYIIGVCMRLRGMLVLHAACVARGEVAVAFVGRSGWGKSTLAAHFVRRGYDLLADDLTGVVVPREGAPVVYPGLAHIRLYPDSGEVLLTGYEGLPRLNAYSEKRVGYAPPLAEEPRQLVRLYALEETFGEATEAVPLTPAEAFPHLAAHTRAMHEFDALTLKRHLQQCGQVLHSVPVALLRRRRSLEALDDVVSLVESDLARAASVSHAA
jgi:hypothetical protein